jgi:DNA-binding NtrC family response regulator
MDKCSVLVAEDNAIIAMLMENLLQEAGYDVVGPVPTVLAAFATIHDRPLDAAVLDVSLRDGLAFPVADKLDAAGVPFVLVTGHGAALVPPRYRARPFVSKPFTERGLVGALSMALRARAPPHCNPAGYPILG